MINDVLISDFTNRFRRREWDEWRKRSIIVIEIASFEWSCRSEYLQCYRKIQNYRGKGIKTMLQLLPRSPNGCKYSRRFSQKSLVDPNEEQLALWRQRLNELIVAGAGDVLFEVGVGDGIESLIRWILHTNHRLRIFNLAQIYVHFPLLAVPGIEDPGLQDDEYEASLKNLKSIASHLDAHCIELNRRKVDEGFSGHCLIRKQLYEQDFLEIR